MKGPARLDRQAFFDDPLIDALINSLTGLAMELGVVKERLDTLERALSAEGISAPELIEAFQPDKACEQARAMARARIINAALGPFKDRFAMQDVNRG